MNDESYEELDRDEEEILRSLAGSGRYSKATENRIVRALRKEALIVATPSPWLRAAKASGMLAAILMAFGLGTLVGDRRAGTPDTPTTTPVLTTPTSPGKAAPKRVPEPPPGEHMQTAFHMNGDDPVLPDPEASKNERLSQLQKSLEP